VRATDETTGTSKKATVQTKTPTALNITPPPKEAVTRNFFAPLKAVDMDTDASGTEANSNEEAVPGKKKKTHVGRRQ
jgi:hypothetical protein